MTHRRLNDTATVAKEVFKQSLHIQGLHQDYHKIRVKLTELENKTRNMRNDVRREFNVIHAKQREIKQNEHNVREEIRRTNDIRRENEIAIRNLEQRTNYLVDLMIEWGVNYNSYTTHTRNSTSQVKNN